MAAKHPQVGAPQPRDMQPFLNNGGGKPLQDPANCGPLNEEGITIGIDFPFEVTLQHAPMGLRQMFELCELLDFHELRVRDEGNGLRFGLIVDLLSLRAEQTRIQIKPREPMSYDDIATNMELLLEELETHIGAARVTELNWLVERKGVASDMRSSQQRVH